ncbi:MAG: hypothetical protein RLZZ546_298 [Bacteroidota bacterium]|jgi:hypothetical protein
MYISYINKLKRCVARKFLLQSDKTIIGPSIQSYLYPESIAITKNHNLISDIFIINNCIISPKTGICYAISDYSVLDKAPYSYHSFDIFKPYKFVKSIDSAINLISPFLNNYYHIHESVLSNIEIINLMYSDLPILLPQNIKNTVYEEILRYHFSTNELIFVDKPVKVNRAFRIKTIFNQQSIKSIKFHEINERPSYLLNKSHKRIFIPRNGANRRILRNQEELEKLLAEHDFVVYDPSRLSYIEQITLIQNAELIVAVHGAAVTNIIYTKNLVNLIEIKDPRDNTSIFEAIAHLVGATYCSHDGVPINNIQFEFDSNRILESIGK